MTRPDQLGGSVVLGAGLVLWFKYPQVMGSILLAFVVVGMLVLSVAAMRGRKPKQTVVERVNAYYDGAPHHWN
jgi:hypothetical protein